MAGTGEAPARERDVLLSANGVTLAGILAMPSAALGIVIFAHGSGSGRLSPRNTMVARALQRAGLATLLLDLLSGEEGEDRTLVFDIDLLAERLLGATAWVRRERDTRDLNIGYFGASTGAAAALQAAARDDLVRAVVSRGGRPDLAAPFLSIVAAPTLLIVGGNDLTVIALNQQAYDALPGAKDLVIIPGATHLFPEPGALEEVARLAADWFQRYLARPEERAV